MYCIKCGVELADSEEKCPLCKTPVYYPNHRRGELTFPEYTVSREQISGRGLYFIISFAFAIVALISLICNLNVNGEFSWSFYVIGALVLAYIVFILPCWFRRPSPAIFIPIDFAVCAMFLLGIDYFTDGGWFWSFALPIVGYAALLLTSFSVLVYYLRTAYLYIWGGELIALGFFMPVLEILLHINFGIHETLVWSYYPMATLVLVGIMLIIIAIVKPFRESLRKIFSI